MDDRDLQVLMFTLWLSQIVCTLFLIGYNRKINGILTRQMGMIARLSATSSGSTVLKEQVKKLSS